MNINTLRVSALCGVLTLGSAFAQTKPILPLAPSVVSTIPAGIGDVNPYGVAFVPRGIPAGLLQGGDILVSNFNNAENLQGTGTTIMRFAAAHNPTLFFNGASAGKAGMTAALGVLANGTVVVGNLATADGTAATVQPGSLSFIDRNGNFLGALQNSIDGPWGMAIHDLNNGHAQVFVSNVLNGTVAGNGSVVNEGTILRILLATPESGPPREIARTVIASGFGERTDPAALVIGPTGLAVSHDGRLIVADTLQNRIAAIPGALFRRDDAGTGVTVSQGGALNGPLGVATAPNGNILTVNAGDGNLVEIARDGKQVAVKAIDVSKQGGGTLFGLAFAPGGQGIYFVDDGNNTLNLLH